MELFLFLLISASCLLVSLLTYQVGVVGNHAAAPLPSEIFLKQKLSNTPMPAILHELLHPATDSLGASLFFLEKDLYPGAKMNLHFVVSTASGTAFLPRNLAKVTPFSSSKLPEILNQEVLCNFIGIKFGKNVNVLTTEISSDKAQRTRMRKQQYVVSSRIRQIVSDNLVACHSLPYPYAVFFCHATLAHTTRAYVVPLIGADGSEIIATAVCHNDTTKWDPDDVAFQVLNVKPGTIPICHFLTEDNIVWAGKNEEK
ncbi:hypothetical protein MKW98_027308 [Papaver atlanticum]|uniref:BURP domain-containing protein n=1 Tax=Papaver atlanticum TaxID=357466 RepID=A0AAD4SRA7_9MAGN|nr:hypothetical protein MKW98_027308 [Papaver atlanticum]